MQPVSQVDEICSAATAVHHAEKRRAGHVHQFPERELTLFAQTIPNLISDVRRKDTYAAILSQVLRAIVAT